MATIVRIIPINNIALAFGEFSAIIARKFKAMNKIWIIAANTFPGV